MTLETPRGLVTIRPTRLEDAAAYRALRLKALGEHPEVYGSAVEEQTALAPEYWEQRMRQGAAGRHGVTYVAEADGQLVGMAALVREQGRKMEHSAQLVSVYVHPDWRGMGIIDKLLEACLAFARELGLRNLKLYVVVSNLAALRVYQRAGFRVYGVEPDAIYEHNRYYDEFMMIYHL